jgi:hypothetical protein
LLTWRVGAADVDDNKVGVLPKFDQAERVVTRRRLAGLVLAQVDGQHACGGHASAW